MSAGNLDRKGYVYVRWIQEGFKGFSVEAPKPHLGAFSGRFGSDSGGLPGCNSDF